MHTIAGKYSSLTTLLSANFAPASCNSILQQHPATASCNSILQTAARPPVVFQVFFCKYNDPLYVKMEKLEIMIKLANERNIDQVLQHSPHCFCIMNAIQSVEKNSRIFWHNSLCTGNH